MEFIGGVQYCFHFDRSSHDAFLKCIRRSARALRESSTAPAAHMNRMTRHPKDCKMQLLHPDPRRQVNVCYTKSASLIPSTGTHRVAGGGLSRNPMLCRIR